MADEQILEVGKLAGLCAQVSAKWEKLTADADKYLHVNVKTSAIPTGAATSANQDTMITALQLIDDLQNALKSVGTDDLQVFPVWTPYADRKLDQNAAAGDNTLTHTVPTGKKWEVTQLIAFNDTSTNTSIEMYTDQTNSPTIAREISTSADQIVSNAQPFTIEAGKKINCIFRGCTAGDDIYFSLFAKEYTL